MYLATQGETDWSIIAFISFLVVTFALSGHSIRLRRRVNLANAAGDLRKAVDLLLITQKSLNPLEILERKLNSGKIETNIALLHLAMGQIDQAVAWALQAKKIARAPAVKVAVARTLDHLRSYPSAEALLGSRPSEAHDIHAGTAAEGADSRLIRLIQHGKIQESINLLTEKLGEDHGPESLLGLVGKLSALDTAGYDELMCLAVERLLNSGSLTEIAKSKPTSAGISSQLAVDKVKESEKTLALLAIAESALQCALKKQDRSLIDKLWQFVASFDTGHTYTASIRSRLDGVVAALNEDEEGVARSLEQLRQISHAYPDDLRLVRICIEGEACILKAARRYREALQGMEALNDLPAARLTLVGEWSTRAELHRALGEHEHADAILERIRRLTPSAGYVHPEGRIPINSDTLQAIQNWAENVEVSDKSTVLLQESAAGEPHSPVASGIAVAAWVLAVPAMFPVFGALPAFALGALSIMLLVKKQPLQYDRRVGAVGLMMAIFSTGTALIAITQTAATTISNRIDKEAWEYRDARWEEEYNHFDASEFADDAVSADAPETETAASSAPAESVINDELDEHANTLGPPDRRISFSWEQISLFFFALIVSIALHEVGHAVAAFWCGDPTARNLGRFSLNPIRHFDPLGSLIVPLAMFLLPGNSVIGWAKPVPFLPHLLRKPRAGHLGITLAGVSLNLLLAFVAANVLIITLSLFKIAHSDSVVIGIESPFDFARIYLMDGAVAPWEWVIAVCKAFILVNVMLAGFNLLPVPPLDGFGVIRALSPESIKRKLAPLNGIGMILALIVVFSGMLTKLLLPAVILLAMLLTAARLVVQGL